MNRVSGIGRDNKRFIDIVKGKIKKDFREKYIKQGEMIGRQGENIVSIPIPQIELPHFRYGPRGNGGVGQGEGKVGTPIGPGQGQPGGGAGTQPGGHILEVGFTYDELADMLEKDLELELDPKGKDSIHRVTTMKMTPQHKEMNTRVHKQRTLKQAIKRHMQMGGTPETLQKLLIEKRDMWNKSYEEIPEPESNALVIYKMDVSGSMTDREKEIIRTMAWWISLWLNSKYKGKVLERFIVHDAEAKVVDKKTFFAIKESGGTKISSAYELADALIDGKYTDENNHGFPPADWNIYPIHFSDGDNTETDNEVATDIVANRLLGKINRFAYVQVKSEYGNGQFINRMRSRFTYNEKVRLSEVNDKDGIAGSIKDIFGKDSQVKTAA